jgi:hypothetical protein
VELYARGLSTRDIEDAFTDETGKASVAGGGERDHRKVWAECEFCKRDLSEHAVI